MPPGGAVDGEQMDGKEGDDSICRNDRMRGVGGTMSVGSFEKDFSRRGVRMVRFAGFRRAGLTGAFIGEGGADRL